MTHRLQIVDNYVIVFLYAVCFENCLIKILPYGILQILLNIDNASCNQSRKLLLYICYLFLSDNFADYCAFEALKSYLYLKIR